MASSRRHPHPLRQIWPAASQPPARYIHHLVDSNVSLRTATAGIPPAPTAKCAVNCCRGSANPLSPRSSNLRSLPPSTRDPMGRWDGRSQAARSKARTFQFGYRQYVVLSYNWGPLPPTQPMPSRPSPPFSPSLASPVPPFANRPIPCHRSPGRAAIQYQAVVSRLHTFCSSLPYDRVSSLTSCHICEQDHIVDERPTALTSARQSQRERIRLRAGGSLHFRADPVRPRRPSHYSCTAQRRRTTAQRVVPDHRRSS